tara:strand:+ start:4070 stop:5314 length:1245 start_codon:yes stop_codon:yes gene_type:complete
MLSRKILILLFLSYAVPQNSMSGYGFGSSVDNSEASSVGVSNELMPSFKTNVSISNPSTWHNLLFSYLNTSVDVQNANFQSNSSTNFSLSSAKLIIPWKQKMAFGVSFKPFLSREVAINDTTMSAFTFNEEDVLYTRMNSSSGGPSQGQLSFGYKLNEVDSVGANLNIIFGSSRYTRNLIIDNEDHLLQSRDYFSGSMIDLFFSTNRINIKDNPIFLSAALSFPLKGIDIENDSYQAFIDLNDNNYHDTNDFPNVGQALLPLNQQFKNEIKVTSFTVGADYEFNPRKHIQAEMLLWKDNGEHNLNSSIYEGFIESKNKFSISYVKFAQPFSRDRYNFKGSLFFQNYGVKNVENINEVGLGLGVGFNFGITGNQIDFGYKLAKRDGLFLVGDETLHSFNVGISIGDLWFVKRREI